MVRRRREVGQQAVANAAATAPKEGVFRQQMDKLFGSVKEDEADKRQGGFSGGPGDEADFVERWWDT